MDIPCDIVANLYFRTRILYHTSSIKQNISTIRTGFCQGIGRYIEPSYPLAKPCPDHINICCRPLVHPRYPGAYFAWQACPFQAYFVLEERQQDWSCNRGKRSSEVPADVRTWDRGVSFS